MTNKHFFPTRPDQFPTLQDMVGVSGLDYMRGMAEGRFPAPPIAQALDFSLETAEEGRVVFTGNPGLQSCNPMGTIHGGWFGTLLDSCMACSVLTRLPASVTYTTLEYKVNIIRPLLPGGAPIRAIGEALHVGRRTGTAEGRIVDAAGKLYAFGTTTCLIFPLEGAA